MGNSMRFMIRIFIILLWASYAAPQVATDDATLRKQALELIKNNQVVQAAPILEGLAQRHPDDMVVQERLGMARLGLSSTLTDPAQSKAMRVKARAALLRAKELGDNS